MEAESESGNVPDLAAGVAGLELVGQGSAEEDAPRTRLLQKLTARHGIPQGGRERTLTQTSSAFSGSPRASPRIGTSPIPPFSLEPPQAAAPHIGPLFPPLESSDRASPPRKPRTRTRVSGHPTPILTGDNSGFHRESGPGERNGAKNGNTNHRGSVGAPTRFVPLNQGLVTTDSGGTILTANETVLRILGYSQSEVTGGDVLSFLGAPYREKQRRYLMDRDNDDGVSEAVLVSGSVVQIVKKDNRSAPASLWLKEKRTMSGSRVLMWVFEPILENNVNVTITKDGKITEVSGACQELFGYSEDELKLRKFWDLVPSLKPYNTVHTHFSITSPVSSSPSTPSPSSGGPFDIEQIDKSKFFGAVTRQGITVPIIAKVADDLVEEAEEHEQLSDEEMLDAPPPPESPPRSPSPHLQPTYQIQIISMPSIAGVITLYADGMIQSCNTSFAKYLFGLSARDLIDKINITALVPQFWTLVNQIGSENLRGHTVAASFSPLQAPQGVEGGIVAAATGSPTKSPGQEQNGGNEALVRTSGVIVYHRDGTPFNVDLQLRAGSPGSDVPYALSITYDRYAANKAAILAHHVLGKPPGSSPLGSPSHGNGKDQFPLPEQGDLGGPSSASDAVRLRRSSVSIERTLKSVQDYNILDTLGEGAYGFVKLAERKNEPDQEKVVIKFVIKSRILVDTWIRDRDLGVVPMEIHVLNYLRKNPHPCVVRIMDYWEDVEFFYIEMHLFGWGMDLFDYIEVTENMTEADIKYIFHQIALAVQHLHKHGIVHRDIKDENVILDENLSIQLIDFGSSAYYSHGKKFDTFCGTLDYASPEVLTGHKYEGPQQDIWALGILLYTMIYKENPFYNIDEIISHPLRVPFAMSPESLDLIRCMLHRDVRSRPTIDEVLSHDWFRRNASPLNTLADPTLADR